MFPQLPDSSDTLRTGGGGRSFDIGVHLLAILVPGHSVAQSFRHHQRYDGEFGRLAATLNLKNE